IALKGDLGTISPDATTAPMARRTPTRRSSMSRTGSRHLGPNGRVNKLTTARSHSRPTLASTWLDAVAVSAVVLPTSPLCTLRIGKTLHGRNSTSSTSASRRINPGLLQPRRTS
ncbi:unnamed protein product, partial [Aphanomyces euteiches]